VTATSTKKVQGLRYVTRFECIGSRCEDTCCRGWEIFVDERHYFRLQKTLAATPEGKADFAASFQPRPPGARDKQSYALLVLQEGKTCTFLTEDQLCRIHRDHGAEVLPNLCALYPRSLAKIGSRFELSTATSCPEAARQLLLHEDACDIVDVSADILPRPDMAMTVPASTRDPWLGLFDVVRGSLYRGVRRRQYPVTSRLFQLASFAQEALPFFHRGCGSDGSFAAQKMKFELQCLEDPAILDEQHARFSASAASSDVTLALLARIFEAHLKENPTRPMAQLLGEVGLPTVADVHPTSLRAVLARTMPSLAPDFLARAETWLENFCANVFLREWYTYSPDVVVYLQVIFVRLNLIRFFLYTHPQTLAAHALPDPVQRREAFDKVAVQVVYRVSRAVDHLLELLQNIEKILVEKQTQTLAYSTLLLQLGA